MGYKLERFVVTRFEGAEVCVICSTLVFSGLPHWYEIGFERNDINMNVNVWYGHKSMKSQRRRFTNKKTETVKLIRLLVMIVHVLQGNSLSARGYFLKKLWPYS
jgi:hypothetical protein